MTSRPKFVSEVESIVGHGQPAQTRHHLRSLVELPLLRACEMLYDKNIRTIHSGACAMEVHSGRAYMVLDYDTMSPPNQAVARRLTELDEDPVHPRFRGEIHEVEPWDQPGPAPKVVALLFRLSTGTTVDYLEKQSLEVAGKFHRQDMLWAPRWTLTEMRETHPELNDLPDAQAIALLVSHGFHYAHKEKRFFYSKEHWEKWRGK